MTRKSKKKPREPYRYRPLEHDGSIRLIELLPGNTNKRVQCRLITANVDNCPPYEAISYVWGKAKDKTRIFCRGKWVKIPTNLLHALQRFRQEKDPRILWADSICVNQRDLIERRKQVQIMGTIFENAKRVLVWLGRDPHSDAKPAFDLVKAITPFCRDLQFPVTPDQEADFVSHIQMFPPSQWDALNRVLHNPWFSRIWVLQEISLANEGLVIYGDEGIIWDVLRTTLNAIKWTGSATPYVLTLGTGNSKIATSIDFRSDRSIIGLLDHTRNFKCSDPRDKIYALLGHSSFRDVLSNSTTGSCIPVDYSLPYSEVYLATAKYLMKENTYYGPFSILSLVGHTSKTIHDLELTSWVPQWNSTYHARVLATHGKLYSASKDSAPQYLLSNYKLEVQGFLFDSIKWQSTVIEFSDTTSKDVCNSSIKEIWKELRRFERDTLTEEEMFRKFCLTLNCRNKVRSGSKYRQGLSEEQRIADCVAFFEAAGINLASQKSMKEKFGPGDRFRFSYTTSVGRERRFFVTERGYYGLGPEVSLLGDQISVIFGADVPFVFWPQRNGTFRLCGECYVHGIMDGEAMEMWENGELEEQTFILT